MRIHFIIHEHFEAPGAYESWAKARGYTTTYSRVYAGESLPENSPEREVGKFPITLTKDGITHPLFDHFGTVLEVGHWHNDMPGLTPDAKVIAYSAGCPRQIVAYSCLVFGFQCHMELTKKVVASLIENDDLSEAANYRFVNEPQVLLNLDYDEMNQKLREFLDKLAKAYQAYS